MTLRRCALSASMTMLLASTTGAARAAVFTVGDDEPAAEFSSLQDAVDAALGGTGYREIRVAAGTYRERVQLDTGDLRGTLEITGGWDPAFLIRSLDPDVTVLDAEGGPGRPLTLVCRAGGTFRVSGLSLTGGRTSPEAAEPSPGTGGGLLASLEGTCRANLEQLRIYGNAAAGDGSVPALGGGVAIGLAGASRATLRDSRVEGNLASNPKGIASVGGVMLRVARDAWATLRDNQVLGNTADGATATIGALSISVAGGGSAIALDNVVARNSVRTVDSPFVTLGVELSAGVDAPTGTCIECGGEIQWHRNRVEDHLGEGAARTHHMMVVVARRSEVALSDSLLAEAPGEGLFLFGSGESRSTLTNLTIARHGGSGLIGGTFDMATLSLANSIVFDNGDDSVPSDFVADHNLVAVDPRFLDAAGGDYRLQVGSPAIDAGTLSPAGGLGPWDLGRRDRVVGRSVDQGAYELQTVSEGGRCAILGPLPLPRGVPVCACLRDASLREMRCAFFHSDLFVTLRLPFAGPDEKRFEPTWELQPWRGVQGPYEIAASLLVDGKAGPAEATKGKLVDGKLATSSVRFVTPAGDVNLRTRLRYLPEGETKPRELVLDALVAAGDK